MLVANDVRRDPRVDKEARSLVRAGYSVAVIGVTHGDDTDWQQAPGGYAVRRVRPEGAGRARVKAGLRSLSPAVYRGATTALRRVRGIPELPARPTGAPLNPQVADQIRRTQMIAGVRSHRLESRVLAAAAIATLPAVVHAHDLNTLLAATWAARATGAALVFDAHEIWWRQHAEGLAPDEWTAFYRDLEAALIGGADRVITVCRSIADFFTARHRIAAPAIVRNSLAAPAGGFVDPASVRASEGPVEVLFHGGFQPNRGLEGLLDATARLDGIRLVLRGFGSLEVELRDRVQTRGLSEVVRFEAPVPMDQVVQAASASQIGVIPYKPVCLNNRFSTPNKLFEYLNAGLAVAASDLPEIRRIVESDDLGALFDPDDPASIAAALRSLTADRQALAAMRRRALAAAAGPQSWAVDEAVLLDLYRDLLPRRLNARVQRMRGRRS